MANWNKLLDLVDLEIPAEFRKSDGGVRVSATLGTANVSVKGFLKNATIPENFLISPKKLKQLLGAIGSEKMVVEDGLIKINSTDLELSYRLNVLEGDEETYDIPYTIPPFKLSKEHVSKILDIRDVLDSTELKIIAEKSHITISITGVSSGNESKIVVANNYNGEPIVVILGEEFYERLDKLKEFDLNVQIGQDVDLGVYPCKVEVGTTDFIVTYYIAAKVA